ncbi:hypothetical protein [Sphingomonas sp. YL-JM2C]
MHSPSLPTPTRQRKAPAGARKSRQPTAAPAEASPPPHLNFSFADWFKARTEPARLPQGWTPIGLLYEDYLAWCAGNDVPAAHIHNQDELAGKLRARDDRAPQKLLIDRRQLGQPVGVRSYELCFPRFLRPAIRVS